jgi:hypothetical protein
MMDMLGHFCRSLFHPEPHPAVQEANRAADRVVESSKKLNRQADTFGAMVRGMHGSDSPLRRAQPSVAARAKRR